LTVLFPSATLQGMAEPPASRLADFRRGLARYTPVTRLAAGGMGEVWRGKASFPDGHVEEVAIKRVLPHLSSDPLYRSMLEDEARLGMLLRHPNIMHVFDARDQGSYIIVMEYVEGRSLSQLLEGHWLHGAPLPIAVSLHVAREIARALEHAHEAVDDVGNDLHIIHGDVSPHNVLLSVAGDVKLMDFGLARSAGNLVVRDPLKLSGKWGYLAPELVVRRECTQLNDVFSLGIVLWECLAGRRLFPARSYGESRELMRRCAVPPPSLENPAVTREIDEVVARALAPRPAERFRSARAFGIAMDRIIETLEPGICARQTAELVCMHLGQKAKARAISDRPGPHSIAPGVGLLRFTEAELEDFFATCDTTVYQRPSLPPPSSADLDAFVSECDTRLMRRPRDKERPSELR
jgi:serine/threonine protein kinase